MAIPEPQLDPSIVSKAPTSAVTPGEIAQPYQMLGHALDAVGQGLEKTSESLAHQAGLKAVSRDADGNPVIEHAPIIGPAANAYAHAVKFAALADAEGELRRSEIQLREKFRDDPQGYMQAADAKKQAVIDQYSKAGGPELGMAIGKGLEGTITQTFRGLQNEKERLDLQRSMHSIDAGLELKRNDLVALARQGGTDTDEYKAGLSEYQTLLQQKVNNPRLAYPPEQAAYDLDNLKGELGAGSFLHKIETTYNDKSVDADGNPAGGVKAALEQAKGILTDRSLNLTEQQRQSYYHKAVGEVHANEAIRHQNLYEARTSLQDLQARSHLGYRIEPQELNLVAHAFEAAGAPGQAALVWAHAEKMPLNDEFGRRSIPDQIRDRRALEDHYGTSFRPEVRDAIAKASAATGVPEALLNKMTFTESRGRYGPEADTGSYKGLLQLSKEEFENYMPGGNIYSPHDNAMAAAKKIAGEQQRFKSKYGRDPTDTETYLVHNQGEGGLDAHMASPSKPAWQNMLSTGEGREKGEAWARAAVWRNVPDDMKPMFGSVDRVTSGDFINLWKHKIERAPAGDNPLSAQWLINNRSNELNKELDAGLKDAVAGWDKDKVRPPDAMIKQLVDGAKATGNVPLLERIAESSARWEYAQYIGQQPLSVQHAAQTAGEARAAAGQLRPDQHSILKDAAATTDGVEKGLKDNPIALVANKFNDRFSAPGPLDMKDPKALAQGLMKREQMAKFAANNYGVAAPAALDKADVETFKGALDHATADETAQLMGVVAGSIKDQAVLAATLHKIGEGNAKHMTAAWAGDLQAKGHPDAARWILQGKDLISEPDHEATKYEYRDHDEWNKDLERVLPGESFTYQDRTQPDGAYATAQQAVRQVYAAMSNREQDISRKGNPARLQKAVDVVTGGIHTYNGSSFIAPEYGKDNWSTYRKIQGLNDADFAGVTTTSGEKITAQYVKDSAQLESHGDGTYRVRLNRDLANPVYAQKGGEHFLLNLKDRPELAVMPPVQRAIGPMGPIEGVY